MKRRILSVLLSACMVVSMVNPVWADENDAIIVDEAIVDELVADDIAEDVLGEISNEPNEVSEWDAQAELDASSDDTPEFVDDIDDANTQVEVLEDIGDESSENMEIIEETSELIEETESMDSESTDIATIEDDASESITEDGIIDDELTETAVSFDLIDDIYSLDSLDWNNDKLFEGYVDRLLLGDKSLAEDGGTVARDRLTGLNRKLYDVILADVKKVATGDLETAQFSYSVDSLGFKSEWTAAELGYTKFTQANVNEAMSKLFSELSYSNQVIYALMYDNPYEFYWFDKTAGFSIPMSCSYSPSSIWFCLSGQFNVSFCVTSEYSKTGTTKTYDINTEKITRVNTAVANAKKVVSDNKSLSDVDKLYAYKDYICDAVEYDHAAAEDSNHDYTDQWQLISVFDEDPTTNVVCEGYAKAYQYLCDMTDFDDDSIHSILVSGYMAGGTGSGGHMYNVMHMDNGQNYLVDVTNCDSGSSGYPDLLFLVGTDDRITSSGQTNYYFLKHSLVYYYNPTTTKSIYGAEDLELSTTNYFVHDFTGYTNATLNYEWKNPVDIENDKYLVCVVSAVCKTCNKKITLASYNCNYGDAMFNKYPTCTSEGVLWSGYGLSKDPLSTGTSYRISIPALKLKALGHKWDEGVARPNGTILKTCQREGCDETLTEGEPTVLLDLTASDFGFTSDSGVVYDGTGKPVTVSAKRGVNGYGSITVKYVGANGGYALATTDSPVNAGLYDVWIDVTKGTIYNEAQLKLGSFEIEKATPAYTVPQNLTADCSKTKYSDVTLPMGFTYANPDASLVEGINNVTLIYTPENIANYKMVEGISAKIVKTSSHSYANKKHKSTPEETVPATCTLNGYFVYKYLCDKCDTELDETCKIDNDADPANGHAWNVGVVTKEPTLKEKGVKTYTCTLCDDTKTEDIDKINPYKITFEAYGGICSVEYDTVNEDGKLSTIPIPTKTGYVFDGWYIDVTDETTKITTNTVFAADTEVTAKWSVEHKAATVWKYDDDKHWHECECIEGSSCQKKYNEAAHTWNKGVITKEPTATETGIRTYTCSVCKKTKTEEIATLPIVTFNVAGGTCGVSNLVTNVNGTISGLPTAEKLGYIFEGWYEDIDDASTKITTSTVFTSDTEVTAKWSVAHRAATEWISDENKHWHNCECIEGESCQKKYNEAIHVWDTGVVTKEATTTETGIRTYTCTVCMETKTEEIPVKVAVAQWVTVSGKKKWQYADGTYAVNKFEKIGGKYYRFDASGYVMLNKWINVSGKYYRADSAGVIQMNKWVTVSGKYYRADSAGVIQMNKWVTVSGKYYRADASGVIQMNKWFKVGARTYRADSAGVVQMNKWVKVGSNYYRADSAGVIQINKWIKLSGKYYWADAKGVIAMNKWVKINGKQYYFNASGVMTKSK